jgi:hypothetical protein
MKVHICQDKELYPIAELINDPEVVDAVGATEVEVDEATVCRWKRVHLEFEAVNQEMHNAADRARGRAPRMETLWDD